MHRKNFYAACACVVGMAAAVADASTPGVVSTTSDLATGLSRWQVEEHGLNIEFVQVPPDFIRASYSARGLPRDLVESVATLCVFGTIVRNVSEKPLSYKVVDWRYVAADGEEHPIKPKTAWLKEWHGTGVRFSWSMLADDVTFEKGDWIQGFTTIPVPHGSRVGIKVVWSIEGKRHEKIIPRMVCAPAPTE